MSKVLWFTVAVAGMATYFVGTGWADGPSPPVNQYIGFKDTTASSQLEATCRGCHLGSQANRHHLLYNTGPLPPATLWYSKNSDPNAPDPIPYPDGNKDGVRDAKFSCITCHGFNFVVNRNCPTCHQRSPHHAQLGNPLDSSGGTTGKDHTCTPCHGSLVNDYNDGHYVPTYAPSLVTPKMADGDGLPLKPYTVTAGTTTAAVNLGAGACDYCHNADLNFPTHIIGDNHANHHMAFKSYFDVTSGTTIAPASDRCAWCHGSAHGPVAPYTLRSTTDGPWCENCHGPSSLHAIQVSSGTPHLGQGVPNVGGEALSGYGHVGKDNGPGDSDCWGCHGFATANMPPLGPVVPYIYAADKTTVRAGRANTLVLTGAAFANSYGTATYKSTVTLAPASGTGTPVTLTTAAVLNENSFAVTIPATTKPGNYYLKAKKGNLKSNPVPLSAIPPMSISTAVAATTGSVTITGNGFGGFQKGAGLYVKGTNSTGTVVTGAVISWAPGKIVAKFAAAPKSVTVKSVFGTASHGVVIQ